MPQANATRSVKDWRRRAWDDTPATEVTGAKLFRIAMSHTYAGAIEGEGNIQYLAADNRDGKGGFVALEKVTGSVSGKSGSFVLQQTGTVDNGVIQVTLIVVPGLGTGDLSSLSGQATIECKQHQESYPIVFEYEL
jgi:hypothetical protein